MCINNNEGEKHEDAPHQVLFLLLQTSPETSKQGGHTRVFNSDEMEEEWNLILTF